jgi:hypothetical protein
MKTLEKEKISDDGLSEDFSSKDDQLFDDNFYQIDRTMMKSETKKKDCSFLNPDDEELFNDCEILKPEDIEIHLDSS